MACLVLRAFAELIYYEILTKLGGFPRVRTSVVRTKRAESAAASPDIIKKVVDAVDVAGCFYVREVRCLHRSFATVRMLRNRGVDAQLIIATRPLPFLSHAWVEVNNHVVNDHKGYKRKLLVLERI